MTTAKPWKIVVAKTGEEIKIDAEDYENVIQRSWRVIHSTKTQKPSVVTSIRTGKHVRTMSLGQYLLRPEKGMMVYPRRWQGGLDYRKSNLLICSMSERQRMLPKRGEKSSSVYKGVSHIAKTGQWRSRIEKEGRAYYIGDFSSEAEAALAYNEKARELFGDIAYQNQVQGEDERRNAKKVS